MPNLYIIMVDFCRTDWQQVTSDLVKTIQRVLLKSFQQQRCMRTVNVHDALDHICFLLGVRRSSCSGKVLWRHLFLTLSYTIAKVYVCTCTYINICVCVYIYILYIYRMCQTCLHWLPYVRVCLYTASFLFFIPSRSHLEVMFRM